MLFLKKKITNHDFFELADIFILLFISLRKLTSFDDWSSLCVHIAMDNTLIVNDISKFITYLYLKTELFHTYLLYRTLSVASVWAVLLSCKLPRLKGLLIQTSFSGVCNLRGRLKFSLPSLLKPNTYFHKYVIFNWQAWNKEAQNLNRQGLLITVVNNTIILTNIFYYHFIYNIISIIIHVSLPVHYEIE